MERWRDVTGWEGRYEVSDRGQVRGARGVLAPYLVYGRPTVMLYRGDRRKFNRSVARLVALAFVPGYRPGRVASPRDGDLLNCEAPNLVWGTVSHSRRLASLNGRLAEKERNGRARLTRDRVAVVRARLARGEMATVIAADEGVSPGAIYWVKWGKSWKGVFPALTAREDLA